MENPYLSSLITQAGVILTSFFTLIGVIIQTKQSNKVKKQNEIIKQVHEEIMQMKKYTDEHDEAINRKIDDITIASCKSNLVSLMSKIENGYKPTTEETRILIETYDFYVNNLHGNSYIHAMYERLKSQNKI